MQNFNTNQTRHLYVAGSKVDSVSAASANTAIALNTSAAGKIFFEYKNADGLIVRSDTIDKDKIASVRFGSTNPAENTGSTGFRKMARPLMAHKIVLDTNEFTFGSTDMVGRIFNLKISVHGVFDYDDNNTITAVASVVGDATNTATAGAFYKALAQAIVKVIPQNDPSYPFFTVIMQKTTTGSSPVTTDTVVPDNAYISDATAIVLVEGPQKYVRGKLSGEPCRLSIASSVYGKSVTSYDNAVEIAWATTTSAAAADILASGTAATLKYVHPLNQLCDLEYFSLGERGDVYRGFNFPNDYDVTYALPKPTSSNFSDVYRMISIQYYWNGNAENVQKSPRLIEIVGKDGSSVHPIADLKTALATAGIAEK